MVRSLISRPALLLPALLLLSLIGVGCAAGIGGVRTAMKKNDLPAAEKSLTEFLAANPDNAEAHMLMGDLRLRQGRSSEAAQAYDRALQAKTPPLTPTQRNDVYAQRFNDWIRLYNSALKLRDGGDPRGALRVLDTAVIIAPDQAQTIVLQSVIARDMSDQALERRYIDRYITLIGRDVDEGLKLGLHLGMTPEQVEAKLGAIPAADRNFNDNGGSMAVRSRRLVLSFVKDDSGTMNLNGWHFLAPDDPDRAFEAPAIINANAWYATARAAYDAGESDAARYDEALRLLRIVERLDPSNEETSRLITNIYLATGRTAEARAAFESALQERPDDPAVRVSYGNLLLSMEDYTGALEQYDRVTKTAERGSTEYDKAIFNSGAAYKNWGVRILDSLRRVAGSRGLTAKQMELYNVKWREATRRFETLREMQGSNANFALLSELALLYTVLNEPAKQKTVLAALEAQAGAEAGNCTYWRTMATVYATIGDEKKSDGATARASDICP